MDKEKEKINTYNDEMEKELEDKLELYDKLINGYTHKSGIKVRATFKENGDDLTECWIKYVRKKVGE